MDANEEWHWEWLGDGTEDPKPSRGRTYYEAIAGYRSEDNLKRIYRVGDAVVMNGEENERWIAQIVELFQVREDDDQLREILHLDSRRNEGMNHYELMRCTLRWFYNLGDVDRDALRRSRVPKPTEDEIYFSDHVEKDGYNDVTVIEGLAWLVSSAIQKQVFLRQPDERYVKSMDQISIVRCFVNSNTSDHVLRNLDKGELRFHLKHPTTDKNLYENGRQRMWGKSKVKGAAIKGTGGAKKRKRTIRPRRDFDDDDEIQPVEKKPRITKSEAKREVDIADVTEPLARRSRQERRRKYVVKEDEEDGVLSSYDNDDAPEIQVGLAARQAQELNAANDEVLDLVTELNEIASLATTAVPERTQQAHREEKPKTTKVGQLKSSSPYAPASNRKKPKIVEQVIVIDEGDTDEEATGPAKREPVISLRGKTKRSGTANRKLDKPRPSFMPTARERKSTGPAYGKVPQRPVKTAAQLADAKTRPGAVVATVRDRKATGTADGKVPQRPVKTPPEAEGAKARPAAEAKARPVAVVAKVDQRKLAVRTEYTTSKAPPRIVSTVSKASMGKATENIAPRTEAAVTKAPQRRAPPLPIAPTRKATPHRDSAAVESTRGKAIDASAIELKGGKTTTPLRDGAHTVRPAGGKATLLGRNVASVRKSTEGMAMAPDHNVAAAREAIVSKAPAPERSGAPMMELAAGTASQRQISPTSEPAPQIKPQSHVICARKPKKLDEEEKIVKVAESDPDSQAEEDWWVETQKILGTLKKEFESMSDACQELFSTHVAFAFDLAWKKVTERGLSGDIDTTDEQLIEVTREILDAVRQKMNAEELGEQQEAMKSAERDNTGTEMEVDRLQT